MSEPPPSVDLSDPLILSRVRPDWSASEPVTRRQRIWIVLACVVVLGLTVIDPMRTARGFVLLSTLFYLAFTLYKLLLVRASVARHAEMRFSAAEIAAEQDFDWPLYSVLVPMYHEPETVSQMVAALEAMDYPADRKDVQFLLEEDDEATLAAARALEMPPGFRVTVIPESFPRTKPKACNLGLSLAKGKYLVIYDAEDRPERDQLKKACLAFDRSPEDVACVQSRLNFYNPRQNLLTRWFTAEYSAWFDLSLPGLAALGAVIPLGGTSNHFVTAVLCELMGWDAYNVTEDCDLGVRLFRAGYRTRMLETTTWEEACSSFPFWIRQRTRWLKGYIQTYMVHMRRPIRLWRELGTRNMIHFQLLVGGIVVSFLLNPLYWALALLWFIFRPDVLSSLFPGPVFAMGALCLFVGNFVFIYINLLGCFRRRYDDLLWHSLLTPVYWIMMSYSGWRAFLQFFSDPFYWEKTQHGLCQKTSE